MKVRQLEHFLAVVEEGQFTQASVRCNIAQSGLSASVRALERELGSPLLHRSTRRVVLTDAGRALVPEARRVLATVDTAREAVEAVVGIERGSLTMGTVISAGLWFDLPGLLAEFHHRHPMVEISLSAAGADELLTRVASLELDMVLMGAPERLPPQLVSLPVASAPYVFACPIDHPLAANRTVDVRDLADEAFVDLGVGSILPEGDRSALRFRQPPANGPVRGARYRYRAQAGGPRVGFGDCGRATCTGGGGRRLRPPLRKSTAMDVGPGHTGDTAGQPCRRRHVRAGPGVVIGSLR